MMFQELVSYSNTGSESCLHAILNRGNAKSNFGSVPNDVATKVIGRFVAVFKSTFLNDKRYLVWCALALLCDPSYNFAADSFSRKLESTTILNHVIEACANYPMTECSASLGFLSLFNYESEKRQSLLWKKLGLIEVLLRVLDSSVSAFDPRPAGSVLRLIGSTVHLGIDRYIESGGFAQLIDTFNRLVARGVGEYSETNQVSEDVNNTIGDCIFALTKYQGACSCQVDGLVYGTIDESMFHFTKDGLRQYTASLNNACDILPPDCHSRKTLLYTILLAHSYLGFFMSPGDDKEAIYLGKDVVKARYDAQEHLMLTPGPLSGVCILLKCVRDLRAADEYDGTPSAKLIETFDEISLENANALAVLEAEIGEKLVYCSLPACQISNLKRGRLKKCNRCMCVWYCGREHQVAHWKEHKPHCCLPSSSADSGTGTVACSNPAKVISVPSDTTATSPGV